VAERVRLTCSPGGTVTWSVSGGGTLSSTSGTTVTYTAGSRTATPTITAQVSGQTCTIQFTVVEPSGGYMTQQGSTIHHAGFCCAGFTGNIFLEPRDVSFENIEFREGECQSTATGSFATAGWNNLTHQKSASWMTVAGGTDATGSQVNCTDNVHSGDLPANCAAGEFRWDIPWLFRVNGGVSKRFCRMLHHATADGARQMTMAKGGVSVSATEPP